MLIIWNRTVPWIFAPVILAVGSEIGQLIGTVPGTYDNLDVVFYIGAFLLAGACHAKARLVNHCAAGNGASCIR